MHDRTTSRVVLPLYCVPSLVVAIPTAMAQQDTLCLCQMMPCFLTSSYASPTISFQNQCPLQTLSICSIGTFLVSGNRK
ncbi:hypothetical protein SLA2020_362810 [Shorea laevis]